MKKLLIICALIVSFGAVGQKQFQNETAGSLSFTSGRVMQLADAIPAEKYAWKPGEGVRSTGEVIAHIVSANYFFAMKLGATLPESVNLQTVEQDLKTKEELTAGLKESYILIIDAIKNTPDAALANKVEFPFPGEYTTMTAALIGLSHTNEHLGQLIAYARSNDITPPWSEQ